MARLTSVFGPYIFIPLIGGLTWLGGILALLLLWVTDGKPRYRGDEASVVFISDVGAVHKVSHWAIFQFQHPLLTPQTLFIVICSVTAGCYVLSLFAERWLRHIDRLPVDLRIREKIFGESSCSLAGLRTCLTWVRLACDLLRHHWFRCADPLVRGECLVRTAQLTDYDELTAV